MDHRQLIKRPARSHIQNRVTAQARDRFIMAEIKHQIPIAAPPEKVYAALATAAGLKGWWTADTVVDERVGGEAVFGFEQHNYIFRMTIEQLDPGRTVVWRCHGEHPEWDGTTLAWSVAREDGASMLRFSHSDWREMSEFCAMCNSTWGELLYRLKAYVESGRANPHWGGS
jgi:uncharacterized protein YndB with AHSA1/START domain